MTVGGHPFFVIIRPLEIGWRNTATRPREMCAKKDRLAEYRHPTFNKKRAETSGRAFPLKRLFALGAVLRTLNYRNMIASIKKLVENGLDILRGKRVHSLLITLVGITASTSYIGAEAVGPMGVAEPALRNILLEILHGHVELFFGRSVRGQVTKLLVSNLAELVCCRRLAVVVNLEDCLVLRLVIDTGGGRGSIGASLVLTQSGRVTHVHDVAYGVKGGISLE